MRKSIIFLLLGIVMLIAMVLFYAYALNHPTASFPFDLSVTYTAYLFYFIIMVAMFVLAFINKK